MSADQTVARTSPAVLWVLLVAQTMATMDTSIVAVATQTIQQNLHATGGELQLVLSGYTLAFSVLVVTGARLGSGLGHRKIFLIGLVGFTVGSAISGLAPTAMVLVGGRVLQGIFAALLVPQVLSLIQVLYTGAARARAIASYSMILALGVAGGQVLGGLVVSANLWGYSWRIAFLINLPLGLLLIALVPRTLPAHQSQVPFRLDLSGVALLAVSMLAVVVPLVFGREHGWPTWTFVLLAMGALLLAVFGWYEQRLSALDGQPILEVYSLRQPGVKPGLVACCILNFAFAGILFPLTMHMQSGLNYTPIEAGLMFLPFPIGFALTSKLASRPSAEVQAGLPVLGMVVFAICLGGLAYLVASGFNRILVGLLLALAGAGMAAGFSTLVTQIAAAIDPKYGSALSAMISTGSLLSGALSVAIVGGVYLAAADGHPARSGTGLSHAFLVDGALLLLGSALALRTRQIAHRAGAAASTSGGLEAEPSPAH